MFCYPDTPDPMRRPPKLKMWKQLKPLYVDRISLFESHGSIRPNKRPLTVNVKLRIQNFYKLSVAQIRGGRTTSRLACRPGDGRGVPKCFQDFGKFSKCFIQVDETYKSSQPLLAGFALRRRLSLSVLKSYNKDRSVSISLLRKSEHIVLALISADLTKMDPLYQAMCMDLFDLDSIDPSNLGIDPEYMNRYYQDIDLTHPLHIPLQPGSHPLPPGSHLLDHVQTTPAEVSVPAGLRQKHIVRQIGPAQFEVIGPKQELPLASPQVVDSLKVDPESQQDLVCVSSLPSSSSTSWQYSRDPLQTSTSPFTSTSSPSSSPSSPTSHSSSHSSTLQTTRASLRVSNVESCRKYRNKKGREKEEFKQEEENQNKRNRELAKFAEEMEEILVRARQMRYALPGDKRKRNRELAKLAEEMEELLQRAGQMGCAIPGDKRKRNRELAKLAEEMEEWKRVERQQQQRKKEFEERARHLGCEINRNKRRKEEDYESGQVKVRRT